MKMPILLQGQTMTEAERLRPLSMGQNWKENGESTATITMRAEDTDIQVGAWIKVFSPNGMSCVMYVKTKRTDYVTGIKTYNLAHCWQMLDEMVIFGEITPATMGGSETEVSPTAAINYLLGRQTTQLFTLGTCCATTAQGWKFQNSDIRSDLQAVADTVLDCEWVFSMDALPWTVSLAQIPTTATMEMRMNRNLSTLSISLDRSDMYTRVYPVGNKDLHISGDYIDRNTATWGIISKVITDNSIDSEGQLRAWATKMLKRNADPVVNVRISGMELSQATGESLDTLIVGQVCRVPLPEYGTTVTERITDISWKDVMLDEVSCTMNLANERKTIQGVLNEIANSGGAGGKRGGTRSGCDLHEHEDQIRDHWTRIQRNDYYIRLEAYERVEGDNYNYSYIEQTASYIRSEVSETANGLSSRIDQTASQIALKVSKGDVATQLAVEAGNVSISGGNLVVDGYITTAELDANYIAGLLMNSSVLSTTYAFSTTLECTTFICNDYTCAVEDAIKSLQITSSGNTYTLQAKHFYSADWETIGTFSRAISSSSWSWVGGSAKVVLQPQNQNFLSPALDVIQPGGSITWDADYKGFTVRLDVDDENGDTAFYDNVWFNTATSFSKGVEAGEAEFSLATVTLQGEAHSVTPISGSALRLGSAVTVTPISSTSVRLGSAGTYYEAGSLTSYYRGNGGSFTVQGSTFAKLKLYGTTTLYYKSGNSYYSTNHNAAWYYADSSGTQYYNAGTTTKISRGDSISVTPIAGGGITCRPVVSSGGTVFYTAGTAEVYRPVLQSGGTAYYTAGTQLSLYDEGSTVSDTYYTKSSS